MDGRRQLSRRYLARKLLNGASLDEIADGANNPLKQVQYVLSQEESEKESANNGLWVVIIIGVIGAIFTAIAKFAL
jgi:hypothetical protein